MSKSIGRINEEKNDNEDEEMEEYESDENEEDYKNQYQKTTEIVDENTYDERDPDELRIKINLEEIEERAPEEEESCISSIILTKDQKSTSKYVNNILILRKLLKYKNILYYYMARWKRLVNHVSLTKSFKKIKMKKRMPMNEYKIGDAIMVNGAIDFDKKDSQTESKQSNSIIYDPKNEKIINNLKFFFEYNRSRKGLLRKYLKIWKECVENLIKKDKEIEKLEQKYKNENINIFEDINNDENCDNSIFKDNNFQGGPQRKELCVKKEITNSKVNKEIKKSFRIGTLNNNVIIKFENNENGNENNNKNEKNEDNGGINSISDDKKENDKIDKSKQEKTKPNKNKNVDKGEKSEKTKKKKEVKTKKKKLKPKKNNNNELKRIFEKINNSKLLKNGFIKWFKNSRIINNIYLNENKNISETPSRDSYSERSTINITNKNNKYNSSESSSKKIKPNKNKNEKDKDKHLKKEEKSHKRKKVNNIVEDYNSTGYDNGDKRFQINKSKENIINNALVPKNFKKNDILNQNKSNSSTLLQKLDQDDEYSISISNNDYSNDNYTSRKKSYVIEEEPVQVRQRRYTNGESPKVQEHTIRMVRLTEPIKEIKDVENGNLEIRFAGEIYEIGTEITTYPTEITETITETTRIISEDTGNENKIYNETEEEITFQGKTFKRITKTVEEDPNKSHSSLSIKKLGDSKSNINSYNAPTQKIGETQRTITSYITPLKKIGEPKRINKNFNTGLKRLGNDEINKNFNNYNNSNYNNFNNNNNFRNSNYTNDNNFNNSYNNNDWNSNLKKFNSQNIFNHNEIINLNDIKSNENDKTAKMEIRRSRRELQNGLDINGITNKNNFEENEFSSNNINYSQKVLPRNKIYNALNEPIKESKIEHISKTYKNPDSEHRSSLQSINSYKSDNISTNELNADSNIKENKKQKDKDRSSEDTIDKRTKKLIKRYKKALNLLKKVIKSKKKRNKSNFDPKLKFQYYFNLFVSKCFPNGLEVYRQNKIAEKNKKENKIILDGKDINNNSVSNKNIINKSPYKNKIKAKMIRIIDIIRTHRRKSRKLKIKLKEKNNLEKLYICFNLWHKNVFDAEDDKNNDEEELCETISSVNGNDYYNDKNKKNMNRSSVASINSINSVKSNNSNSNSNNNNKNQKKSHNKNVNKISKNKDKSKIKKVKNNDKINSILKKFVLKNEKINKNIFFKKWQDNSLLDIELSQSIPYSKPKSVHLNEIQIPRQKIIKYNKSSGKLIDLKQAKKDKIIDINTSMIENGKKVNIEDKIEKKNKNKSSSNIITINTNIDVSTKKNKPKNVEEGHNLKKEDRKEFNKEEEYDDEEEEDIGEEIKQRNSYKNNRSNNELNGNIYTRVSNNEKKQKFNNKNIKIKKDENINIRNDQNIKPENISIDIKDKLIKLLKKINDKTNLYFYFIKWHNIILFNSNHNETKEEETVIVTPRRIISKIVKNFSPVKETNNSDKNNNLLRILRKKEQEILNDNNTNESLPFLKRNKTRIFVKNELSENKKRSKTLLTHQKIGNMTINTRPSYSNELDDEESFSERFKTIKPMKHFSNMNINSPKKRRILLKKKENRNISEEEESNNNNMFEKENNKKNLVKTHIGNIIVKSKKIDDNQLENINKEEVNNTNVTDKIDIENKINSSKNSSKKIIMTIKKNNNQRSEKKKIKKVKNKNIEKDAKREKEKENENILIQNINDLSENNTKMMNENIKIIKNNKNFNLLDNNDVKEKYLSLLKKQNYELGAYRIFYLYSLINDNNEFYRLRCAFKKWKRI